MLGRLVFIAILLCGLTLYGEDITIDTKTARVTNDIGTQGKAQNGSMPDTGDAFALPLKGIEPGVYYVLADVRTGGDDPGVDFVGLYRMRPPDEAFAKGAVPHDLQFGLDTTVPLKTVMTGPTWKLIRGRIMSTEPVFLKPGQELHMQCVKDWANVWQVILRPAKGRREECAFSLSTDKRGNRFTLDERVVIKADVTNWQNERETWSIAAVVTDKQGREVTRTMTGVDIQPRSLAQIDLEFDIKKQGVYKLSTALSAGKFLLREEVLEMAVVPVPDKRYPFVIPGDDSSKTVTDMSGLSPGPAGADGFVRIKNSRFHTDSGRLRIWGLNVCFSANFPTHEEAEKASAHLAKLGINGMRMHHHDGGNTPRGIWKKGFENGKRVFDPDMVDRLDYFLDQLNRNGIYVNLNLHVSRTFTAEEGYPVEGLPRDVRYNKYVLYYMPGMRDKFKDFCREYLTHENPYRKLRRVDDPGIAMLEITNENAFSRKGAHLAASLPDPYHSEFKKQWNAWLAERYKSTDELVKAWKQSSEPLGADLRDMGNLSVQVAPWDLRQSRTAPVKAVLGQPGPKPDIKALKLDIIKPVGASWQHELMLRNMSVEKGRLYTLSFWVKADKPRTTFLDVSNQGPGNWRALGYKETLKLTPEWQFVKRVFRASETIDKNARVCFKFGGSPIDMYLAQVRIRKGGLLVVLPEGQSIEQRNIDIPVAGWADEAQAAVHQFMVHVEKDFIRDVSDFLKKDLSAKVPITASQITYHSPGVVADTCDYTDIHAYWHHPSFPGRPWDSRNWFVRNTPMEKAPAKDSLLTRAPWRLLDRPFTISEWNIPAPHDYAASVVPFAGMVASLQDWDGVFFFTYSNGRGWFENRTSGYFGFGGHPAKLALLTVCANMYRRGDLEALPEIAAGTLGQHVPAGLAMSRSIGIDPKREPAEVPEAPKGNRLAADDKRAVWDATNADKAYVAINSPCSRAVWGLIAEQEFDLGGLKIKVGKTERDYAVICITSLDGKPLEKSQRMLLVAVGSAENLDMQWNVERTSVSNQWGKGPTQINVIPATITIANQVRMIHVLDGTGKRTSTTKLRSQAGKTTFNIGLPHKTLWYELEAEQ